MSQKFLSSISVGTDCKNVVICTTCGNSCPTVQFTEEVNGCQYKIYVASDDAFLGFESSAVPFVFGMTQLGNVTIGGMPTDTVKFKVNGNTCITGLTSISDLCFNNTADRCITMGSVSTGTIRCLHILGESIYCTSSSASAGKICIRGGCATGTTSISGGNIQLCGGLACGTSLSGSDGVGGHVYVSAGYGYAKCGSSPYVGGGFVTINGGHGCVLSGTSRGGDVYLQAGCACGSNSSSSSTGGNACITGGASAKGIGGGVIICGSNGGHTSGTVSGCVNIVAGCSTTTGGAGSIFICGGCNTSSGAAGSVTIKAGQSVSGTDGNIYLLGLPVKSTETNILYIDSAGKIASGATSGGVTKLSGLTDVTITSPTNGNILTYTGSTWRNLAPLEVGTNLLSGDILYYNGTTITGSTNVRLKTGAARCVSFPDASAGAGSALCVKGQNSTSGVGGAVCMIAGTGTTTGGAIVICGGNGTTTGGAITISAGNGGTTDGNVCILTNSQLAIQAIPSSCVELYYNNAAKLCTVTNGICLGTNCGFATDWVASSDKRLKTDIQPISNALSMIVQLQGVCYHLCDDCDCKMRVGLVAQDVVKILPEIVSHNIPSDDDVKYGITDEKLGLKYDKLTAVLIEAIKEQQIQIVNLKTEIDKLKNCC